MQARGLKQCDYDMLKDFVESRLMQARGLKLHGKIEVSGQLQSRLMQARGLKPNCCSMWFISSVAPHAGAWIETKIDPDNLWDMESRLMQARGLKQ